MIFCANIPSLLKGVMPSLRNILMVLCLMGQQSQLKLTLTVQDVHADLGQALQDCHNGVSLPPHHGSLKSIG